MHPEQYTLLYRNISLPDFKIKQLRFFLLLLLENLKSLWLVLLLVFMLLLSCVTSNRCSIFYFWIEIVWDWETQKYLFLFHFCDIANWEFEKGQRLSNEKLYNCLLEILLEEEVELCFSV